MNTYLSVITNLIDIIITTLLVYSFFKIIVKSEKMIFIINGIIIILSLYWVSIAINLNMVNTFLQNVFSWGIVLIFILFQDEIKGALEALGNTTRYTKIGQDQTDDFIEDITDAAFLLAKKGEGALITFELSLSLTKYTEKAIKLDSDYSQALVLTIFNKESALHDGSIIVRDGKITHASAFFPIEVGMNLDKKYGTRHRAALTLSKETDAIILIVSEENRSLSIAYKENLYADLERDFIIEYLSNKLKGNG